MASNEHFKIYIAAYLVLLKNNQVLLLRRFNTGYQDGNYSLIAGHLDGRETAKECIAREAKEEAGIIVKSENLKVVHVMHRLSSDREYIDIYLQSEKWNGEEKNMEPEKHNDLNWFALNNLPSNIIPEVKFALENLGNEINYTDFGW